VGGDIIARLIVKVVSAYTKAPLFGVPVRLDGLLEQTAVDGTIEFDIPVCRSYTLSVKLVGWRPYLRYIHLREEKVYHLTVELEEARF